MKPSGSMRRVIVDAGAIYLSRCATAGAILTCVAAVMNVGPFGVRGSSQVPGGAIQKTLAIAVPATQTDMEANVQQDLVPPVTQAADTSAPVGQWLEWASLMVNDFADPTSQPSAAKDEKDAQQDNPPPKEVAAGDATAQAREDASADVAKNATIVGIWAPDNRTCTASDFRHGILPAVITPDGASAGETFCIFKNKRQTDAGLKVVAECSNSRERWTANVQLIVDGNRLTWTSKRGTQSYTRCASDTQMAQAR